MKFAAAAVQIAPVKADYRRNLERTAEAALRCAAEGADLAVFPETSLTGYFLEGGVSEVAAPAATVADDLARAISPSISRPLDLVCGFYELHEGNVYNSSLHVEISPGGRKLLHVHRKFFIPTYGVFDEERFVSKGRDIRAYETRFGKSAILICEDVWHSVSAMIAALKGAQFISVIAASPARDFSGEQIGNVARYEKMVTSFAEEHGIWAVLSMLVGFEGGKGFTGGSIIADPFGNVTARGPIGEEHILLCEIDLDAIGMARQQLPLFAALQTSLEDVAREISEVDEEGC